MDFPIEKSVIVKQRTFPIEKSVTVKRRTFPIEKSVIVKRKVDRQTKSWLSNDGLFVSKWDFYWPGSSKNRKFSIDLQKALKKSSIHHSLKKFNKSSMDKRFSKYFIHFAGYLIQYFNSNSHHMPSSFPNVDPYLSPRIEVNYRKQYRFFFYLCFVVLSKFSHSIIPPKKTPLLWHQKKPTSKYTTTITP